MKRVKTATTFKQKPRVDIWLLLAVLALTIFGLLMVYDASLVQAFGQFNDKYYFVKQQLIWVILGVSFLTFFSFFDYHHLERLALPGFIISLILLVLVFVPGLGVKAYGAHRWLNFFGIFSLQPAEIIKLSTIIFMSTLFKKKVRTFPFLIIVALVTLIVGVLQRDLGTTIIFVLISSGIYFAAGAPIKYFISLIPIGMIAGGFLIFSSAYRQQRVLAFLDPFSDPQGFTYHISQVLIALGSGGLFGLGIGQSRQKFNFIPEVTTDSIFSIVGEEFGFLGSLLLIFLFMFLVFRGFKIAQQAPDQFGKLLAIGLVLWFGSQTVINLAAMVSLIPLTGVPLPFISYGGSALLANLMAVGILLNISKAGLDS